MKFFVQCSSLFRLQKGPKTSRKKGLTKKRFLIFRHFGRLWLPKSDLSVGQAEAYCETFWRVKCMFTHRHIMSMPLFQLKHEHFSIRSARKTLDPQNEIGVDCETFWRLSPPKHRGSTSPEPSPTGDMHAYGACISAVNRTNISTLPSGPVQFARGVRRIEAHPG